MGARYCQPSNRKYEDYLYRKMLVQEYLKKNKEYLRR